MKTWLIRRNEDGFYWGDGLWVEGTALAHQYDDVYEAVRHWVQLKYGLGPRSDCEIVLLCDEHLHQHLHQLCQSGNFYWTGIKL